MLRWGWTSLEFDSGRTCDMPFAMSRRNPGFAAAAIFVAGAWYRRQYGDLQLADAVVSGPCRWRIRSSLCSSQTRFQLMETGSSLQNRLSGYPQFERFRSQCSGRCPASSGERDSAGYRWVPWNIRNRPGRRYRDNLSRCSKSRRRRAVLPVGVDSGGCAGSRHQ